MCKRKSTNPFGIVPAAFIVTVSWGGNVGAQGYLAQPTGDNVSTSPKRYADGVYTATGQYGSLPSFITVTVTLKDGIITHVLVTPHATVQESLEFQRKFAAAVPRVVVGKPINGLRVGKLAGSSGTPRGFNVALQQIRDQAGRRNGRA